MKNYKLLLGLAAGLFFAGCSTDDVDGGFDRVVEADEVRYLNVAVCTSGAASRAPENGFAQGIPTENAIKSVRFFFYDVDGNPTASSVAANLTFEDVDPNDPNENVEKRAQQTLQVGLKKGDKLPAYIVCLINSVNNGDYDNTNMHDLRLKPVSDVVIKEDGVDYFKMNNSVYYGKDVAAGKANTRVFGTPIAADTQLHSTSEAAEAAPAVDIYVERYAARVDFKQTGPITPVEVNNYTLTFVPEAWGINADVATTYVAKRFVMQTDEKADYLPSYGEIDGALAPWGWNDPTLFRSYWACSPSYYAAAFPEVSDDIMDQLTAGAGTGAGQLVGDYKLKYYSHSQLTNLPAANARKVGDLCNAIGADGAATTLYVKENTASAKAFGSDNPKAAVPSVVLAGHYLVTKTADAAADAPEVRENTDFYLYGQQNGKQNLYVGGAYTAPYNIKKAFIDNQMVLALDDTEGVYLRDDHAALVVEHPSKEVRQLAGVKVPSRYVTLQIDEENANYGELYFLDVQAGGWAPVTAENVTAVNVRLLQMLGYAQMYAEGACYYSIPVQHLRFGEANADGTVPNRGLNVTDPKFDWKKVRPGDFGLVRNHLYTINVTKIEGQATGVSDVDAPIVPPMDEDQYYVSYKVNILKWAVVPEQEVQL